MANAAPHYAAVVIGSGFGGTMTALPLARAFKTRPHGEKLLMLERGTWWTTPVGTVQDKEVAAKTFLDAKHQPVQFWSSTEHFRGFLDIFTRCVRRARNPDGLYDLTNFGRYWPFRLGLMQNDGITILRASGVGGGSLVYANVTIRPPEFILEDPGWTVSWDKPKRDWYYELARDAIGVGVLWALNDRASKENSSFQPAVKGPQVNSGLSNIVTRSARLEPKWIEKPNADNPQRPTKQIDPAHWTDTDVYDGVWIDRARIFQTEMRELTTDFGTVDSSINDIEPELGPFDAAGKPISPFQPPTQPKNYCERQGRCIVGCLAGARHTLNKQLMGAVLGGPPSKLAPQGIPPLLDGAMELQALAEVDVIKAGPGGGPPYEIHYDQRAKDDPTKAERRVVTADRVIVAAGCVGTNEIMLRSKRKGLPNLSDQLGYGFSTNGDYLAFLTDTRERVSLTRGPVTTSFAHFNAQDGDDEQRFHTIEDNGIPRALASLVGRGVPLFKSLSKGRHTRLFIWWALALYVLKRVPEQVKALFTNFRRRSDELASEDELTMNMMCIAAMGRAAADARFRLGGLGETPLRVKRDGGARFLDDPIYADINATLDRFAQRLTPKKDNRFINPFVGPVAGAVNARSIGLSHPLGGSRMGRSAADGVCDEFGRVFDTSKQGGMGLYAGLYITDAARIPTALGVNPSLTISALALYSAEQIIKELP